MVVGVHTAFVSGFTVHDALGRYTARLDAGVEVFFVISGFLLYRRFALAHLGGRPSPGLVEFWKRRLARIVPAYWAAFIVISYLMRADNVRHSWDAPLVYLGFAQIYFPHYILTGITQAWSLCTEMSFYLFLPLYAAALGRRARTARQQLRVEVAGIVTMVGVCVAYRILVSTIHSPLAATMPNWLPGYIGQFALGMALAVASVWLEVSGTRPAWLWHSTMPWAAWGLAAACYVAVGNLGLPVSPLGTGDLPTSLAKEALYGAFGLFMVVPAVFGPPHAGPVRALLTSRALVAVGVVSYGLYLWHQTWVSMVMSWSGASLFSFSWPILFMSASALGLACAAISYIALEKPVIERSWPASGLAAWGAARLGATK
jgi:peptidoglycan/LPS O-acetylase OafA/YrhL